MWSEDSLGLVRTISTRLFPCFLLAPRARLFHPRFTDQSVATFLLLFFRPMNLNKNIITQPYAFLSSVPQMSLFGPSSVPQVHMHYFLHSLYNSQPASSPSLTP